MSGMPLTSVQQLNLLALATLMEESRKDPMNACNTFGVTKSQLEELMPHLSVERLLALLANAPDQSVVLLRPDIAEVLAGPTPLMGALTAVRCCEPLRTRCAASANA